MADRLAGAIVFAPASADGLFAAEPVLQLARGHVDELVPLPVAVSARLTGLLHDALMPYSMTVSLSLTILRGVAENALVIWTERIPNIGGLQ